MNNVSTIVVNTMEMFAVYLLSYGFIQKRASFRLQRTLILVLFGILVGVGFIYVNEDFMRVLYFLLCFIITFKSSNLRLSSSFILFILVVILMICLQVLTTVVTLLPIKEYYIQALLGDSLYLIFAILIYWKIPISKLLRLMEQNVAFKFIFFIICMGLSSSFIILDFNAHKVSPYILHYIIAVFLSGLGIYETALIIRKYTSEIPARYHEHDNLIAGLVSLYMTYGNDELRDNVSSFLVDFGKEEYADKLSVTPNNKEDFLAVFLNCKQGKALEKEIKITSDITYVENKRVSKTDTIKIIGIMLDNAIENSENGQEIFTEIFIAEHIFDVEVQNPYQGSAEDLNQIFQKGYSSKRGSLGGHGLNNLWKIVDKHNGKVMVQPEDGSITFKVVI